MATTIALLVCGVLAGFALGAYAMLWYLFRDWSFRR